MTKEKLERANELTEQMDKLKQQILDFKTLYAKGDVVLAIQSHTGGYILFTEDLVPKELTAYPVLHNAIDKLTLRLDALQKKFDEL